MKSLDGTSSSISKFSFLPPYYQYKLQINPHSLPEGLRQGHGNSQAPSSNNTFSHHNFFSSLLENGTSERDLSTGPEIKPFKLDLTACSPAILKTTPTTQNEALARNDREKKTAEVLLALAEPISLEQSNPNVPVTPELGSKNFRVKWKDHIITKKNITKKTPRKHPHVIHRNSNACSQHRKKHQRCPLECLGRLKDQQQFQQHPNPIVRALSNTNSLVPTGTSTGSSLPLGPISIPPGIAALLAKHQSSHVQNAEVILPALPKAQDLSVSSVLNSLANSHSQLKRISEHSFQVHQPFEIPLASVNNNSHSSNMELSGTEVLPHISTEIGQ